MQPADEGSVLGSIRSYASRLTKAGHTPADCRVLVVDDEATVRRYVVHVLKAAGYQTSAASNAVEAIEAFANGAFEALVTDVMMPGMTGDELARQLRQIDRGAQGAVPDRLQRSAVQGKNRAVGRRGVPRKAVHRRKACARRVSLLVFGRLKTGASTSDEPEPEPAPIAASTPDRLTSSL